MTPIPLNLMTLYADLLQDAAGAVDGGAPFAGSIAAKTVKGRRYLYYTYKDGASRVEVYLGPAEDAETQRQAAAIRMQAARARNRRQTVSLLKSARIPGPTIQQGRILEVLANAGLFARGMTLVGTVAYQTYPCIVGAHLASAALATNDIDLSIAEFVASGDQQDLGAILKRADATFEPVWHVEDKAPRMFRSKDFQVAVLTGFGRGRKSPVAVEALGCSAEALSFQEYPAAEAIEAIALYGPGILVRVPSPVRFAIHKLLVAQRRRSNQLAKRRKDLAQANELIGVLLETDEAGLQDALDGARSRGRTWQTAINASLRELGRVAVQGRPPVAD